MDKFVMTFCRPRGWWIASISFATSLAICANAATAASPSSARKQRLRVIDYAVERLRNADGDRYLVTLRFNGDARGKTSLIVPSEWASAQRAEDGIEALTLLTRDARIEDTDRPDIKRIVHWPGAALVVRYALKQVATGEPTATAKTQYLPVIQPGYFEWIGWTAWAR